ncbi:HNH endonuclease [Proteiniphilum sp. X52]|uniref:HNH endonuclease n=1 Tax=Proteiniphilum sp. X52 TaxID=2382159 RepID=UPI003519E6FA
MLRDSSYWNEVKRLVRLRDNFACTRCGQRHNLEVHHKTYYKNGKSIVGSEKEHLECLELLCEVCHQKEHQK